MRLYMTTTVQVLLNQKYEEDEEEDDDGPNYRTVFPKPALIIDRKFMRILRKMKNEFDDGCKEYLGNNSKKNKTTRS